MLKFYKPTKIIRLGFGPVLQNFTCQTLLNLNHLKIKNLPDCEQNLKLFGVINLVDETGQVLNMSK